MIRTALSNDPPDKFMVFQNEVKKSGNLSNIGVGSDNELKNYNPELDVRG